MHSSRMRTARSLPYGEVSMTENPRTETHLDRDPPGQRPPLLDRDPPPPGQRSPPGQRLPRQRPLWTNTPLMDRDPRMETPMTETETPCDRDLPPGQRLLDKDPSGQRPPPQRPPWMDRDPPGQRPSWI